MEYEQSYYNFYVNYDNKIIYFNGISKTAFTVNEKEHSFFQKQFNNLSEFEAKYPTLLRFLFDNFFIKEKSFDELDYIRYRNKESVFNNSMYRITINPTLDCNFNCWYCYEEHPKGFLNKEFQDKIVKHVEYLAKRKLVRGISLSWFGGEPLLYFDLIVQPISLQILKICNENELQFDNHATTNAYCINAEMIEEFKKIKMNSFQITIDGDEERHNKIRNAKGEPSFLKIIGSINAICQNIADAHIILRINYDDVTLKKIRSLFNCFNSDVRKKIHVNFNRVWQTVKHVDARDEKDVENSKLLNEIINECIEMGYSISFPDDISRKFIRCYADRYWHVEMNYDGKLFKCGIDYSEESEGEFKDDGHIEWKREVSSTIYGRATFENEMCVNCKLLPICLGPCSRKMSKIDRRCTSSMESLCNMKTSDLDLNKTIITYFLLQTKRFQNEILSA